MKKISKVLSVIAAAGLLAMPLAACCEDPNVVKVYAPDGAPAIALSAMLDGGFAAENGDSAQFTVVAASTIAAKVSSKQADMAIMPVNAAATLYNKGVDIVMLTVNTHGNLFIVGDGEEITLSELVGKRLGVIGQGQVPDQVMRMLFDKAGIQFVQSDDSAEGKVALRYADDGGALMPLLKQGKVDYALLAEPAATTAVKNLQKSVVLDIQEEWFDRYEYEYPQACLVAQGELVDNNREFIDAFVKQLQKSDAWAEANPDKALAAVKANMETGTESTLSALDAGIVERCNIRTELADAAQNDCTRYFTLLTKLETGLNTFALDKVPDAEFYYQMQA